MQRLHIANPPAALAVLVLVAAGLASPATAGQGQAAGVVPLNHPAASRGAAPSLLAAAQLSLPLVETPGWSAAPDQGVRLAGTAGAQPAVTRSRRVGERGSRGRSLPRASGAGWPVATLEAPVPPPVVIDTPDPGRFRRGGGWLLETHNVRRVIGGLLFLGLVW